MSSEKPKGAIAIHKETIKSYLKRIENNVGEINHQPTLNQRSQKKEQGNPYTKNYYVYQKYLDEEDITISNSTQ